MPIKDAIRGLNTEHEIFFLLTAYIEALGFCDDRCLLPWQTRDLPLAGSEDVKARIDGLRFQLFNVASDANDATRFVIEETIDIFDVALRRLALLKASYSLPRAA